MMILARNSQRSLYGLSLLFSCSVFLFIFFSIVDPVGGVFRLKLLFFGASIFCFILMLISNRTFNMRANFLFLLLVVVFIVPFISYFIVLLGNVEEIEESIRIQYLIAFLPLLLLLPVDSLNIPIHKYAVSPLLVISFLILATFGLSTIGISFGSSLGSFLDQGISAAKIGPRDFNGFIVYMVYYKTSVLLVFLMAHFATGRNFFAILFCLLVSVALVMSATRANAIVGSILLASYIYFYIFDRVRVLSYLYALFIIVAGLLMVYIGYQHFFSLNEISNKVKIGHIIGYLEYFSNSGVSLVLGSGAGTGFYTPAYDKFIYASELSYFELYRLYGILSIPFLFLILYPLYAWRNLGREYGMAWVCYLLVAGTNPLLLSSTGMVAILIIYGKIFSSKVDS